MELVSVDLKKIKDDYNPYDVQLECDLYAKYEQKKIDFLLDLVEDLSNELIEVRSNVHS